MAKERSNLKYSILDCTNSTGRGAHVDIICILRHAKGRLCPCTRHGADDQNKPNFGDHMINFQDFQYDQINLMKFFNE